MYAEESRAEKAYRCCVCGESERVPRFVREAGLWTALCRRCGGAMEAELRCSGCGIWVEPEGLIAETWCTACLRERCTWERGRSFLREQPSRRGATCEADFLAQCFGDCGGAQAGDAPEERCAALLRSAPQAARALLWEYIAEEPEKFVKWLLRGGM